MFRLDRYDIKRLDDERFLRYLSDEGQSKLEYEHIAFILGLHLIGIIFSIGFKPVGVRDFGLAAHIMDAYTLDNKLATTAHSVNN